MSLAGKRGIGRSRTARFRSLRRRTRRSTKSPQPPTTGSLWQPAQELESGPLVRVNARIDAALALGRHDRLRRLRPSGAVLGGELGLEQSRAALDQRRQRGGACCGDGVEIDMGAERLSRPSSRPRPGDRPTAASARRRPRRRVVSYPAAPAFVSATLPGRRSCGAAATHRFLAICTTFLSTCDTDSVATAIFRKSC